MTVYLVIAVPTNLANIRYYLSKKSYPLSNLMYDHNTEIGNSSWILRNNILVHRYVVMISEMSSTSIVLVLILTVMVFSMEKVL